MPTSNDNAALEVIVADYQRYHAVLVVVAGIFLAVTVVVAVVCARSLRSARRQPSGPTRRQRWTYRALIALAVAVGLFLMLVIVANVSTVLDPQRGFAGVDQSGRAITSWLASGSPEIPADVQERIDARLAWQRPKAIIVTVLLIVVASAAVWIWRRWIARRYPSRAANALLLMGGISSTAAALLLMLMVMGNVQASMAPIALTLVFG